MGLHRRPVAPSSTVDLSPWLHSCSTLFYAARKAQGLSSSTLAALIGTVHPEVRRVEQGTFPRAVLRFFRTVMHLGLSMAVLCPDDPDDPRLTLQRRVATASPEIQAALTQCLDLFEAMQQRNSSI